MAPDSKVVTAGRRKPPNAGKGRKKGVPNKVTRAAKEAIQFAFDELGGAEALATWARANDKNKAVFYSVIFPKIIPHEVTGENGKPLLAPIIYLPDNGRSN